MIACWSLYRNSTIAWKDIPHRDHFEEVFSKENKLNLVGVGYLRVLGSMHRCNDSFDHEGLFGFSQGWKKWQGN